MNILLLYDCTSSSWNLLILYRIPKLSVVCGGMHDCMDLPVIKLFESLSKSVCCWDGCLIMCFRKRGQTLTPYCIVMHVVHLDSIIKRRYLNNSSCKWHGIMLQCIYRIQQYTLLNSNSSESTTCTCTCSSVSYTNCTILTQSVLE